MSLVNYEVKTVDSDIPADGQVYQITVSAGSGRKILGGGWRRLAANASDEIQVVANAPVEGTNPYWDLRVVNRGSSTTSIRVYITTVLYHYG